MIRISFSISTNTKPFGMSSENRFVSPAGRRKKRPTANRSAKAIVPNQAPPPMSC